ncbi:MAG: radical SAM protein [Alphaproteobacteria bacterium]
MSDRVIATLIKNRRQARAEGRRVAFSPHRCFAYDDGPSDRKVIQALSQHLLAKEGLAIYGAGPFLDYLLTHAPALRGHFQAVLLDRPPSDARRVNGLPACGLDELPTGVRCAFLAETAAAVRMQMASRLKRRGVETIDLADLAHIAPEAIPLSAWVPLTKNIYPLDLPEIAFERGLDLLLIDCPARNLALMPNGLGYVHNALKKTKARFQTFDLDIVAYHRFHVHRLYDLGGKVVLPSGRELPTDPWQAENYDLWSDAEVIGYFLPIIEEAAAAIIEAQPKILGLSVQQCSERFSAELVTRVKAALPDVQIIAGGFSCYNADIGLKAFPLANYMCIGEADLTVGPLVEALARGERPNDLPGVLSHRDTPDRMFIPAPMPHNLDKIEPPRYDWATLDLYRNYNDYQLTPIIASRGCRWSRCTFCAERFYWRIRSPQNFVDELEWLVEQGCTLFMFNESDLNGMPEKLLEICDEIIRRKINIKLTGQLRIHKKSDRAFFDKLREAGFVALRFGVDAFSANTMRLQKKGYTPDTVSQNLKDCWEAGIYTEVNWVIGVPGETEADIDEGIALILKNQPYIGRLANFNPLILVNGGVYWIDPEAHGIRFRAPKDELYAKYPRAIPADMWYSVDPFIDAQVRKDRFERIVLTLHERGFPVGAWAQRVIDDVKLARDRARAGVPAEEAAAPAPAAAEAIPLVLLRETEGHRLYRSGNAYYAVPLQLGELAADADIAAMPGVVQADSEEALLDAVEGARDWANSRGRYDPRLRQRRGGSYLRAGSFLGEDRVERLPEGSRIIRFGAEHLSFGPGVLEAALDRRSADYHDWPPRPQPGARPRTTLRRIARLLPESTQAEMRRLLNMERLRSASTVASSPSSDLDTAWAVVKGFWRDRGASTPSHNGMTVIPGLDCQIKSVVTKDAQPELMRVFGNYNIVRFDGVYYGMPHGVSVDWTRDDAGSIAGVITGRSAKVVVDEIAMRRGLSVGSSSASPNDTDTTAGRGPAGEISKSPVLVRSLPDYDILSYEGWIYGIPKSLGDIDLTELDVMEMPGVVRDVSLEVVVQEIQEAARGPGSQAAE